MKNGFTEDSISLLLFHGWETHSTPNRAITVWNKSSISRRHFYILFINFISRLLLLRDRDIRNNVFTIIYFLMSLWADCDKSNASTVSYMATIIWSLCLLKSLSFLIAFQKKSHIRNNIHKKVKMKFDKGIYRHD